MSWLEETYARRRERARERAARVPEEVLRERAARVPPPQDFAAALADGATGDIPAVIAEVKFASPSRGMIRAEKDVEAVAAGYARAGAAALSVLTDVRHFGGDPSFVARAKLASGLPVLRKDFLATPYDVVESRAAGADAVLLIARCLEGAELAALLETARGLGMAALVELHGREDLAKTAGLPVTMVGVNHRDLESLAVDPGLSERMAPELPAGAVRVAESGLSTAGDLRRAARLGYGAVLMGTAFMVEPDPGAALSGLLEACRDAR